MREGLEARPDLLKRGPVAVLHAIMDRVVDDYGPVIAGLENDIDEIEDDVFGGRAEVSRRIYELAREVIAFQRATTPLPEMLGRLMGDPTVGDEERRYLRDVQDHALRVQEQTDAFRQLLQNILNVNLTLETKMLSEASNAQNEEVKRISAWAAILFAPTLIGTIYGMNFDHMPELHWRFGYPYALALMLEHLAGALRHLPPAQLDLSSSRPRHRRAQPRALERARPALDGVVLRARHRGLPPARGRARLGRRADRRAPTPTGACACWTSRAGAASSRRRSSPPGSPSAPRASRWWSTCSTRRRSASRRRAVC